MIAGINSNIVIYKNYNNQLDPNAVNIETTLPELNALNKISREADDTRGAAFFLTARHRLKDNAYESLVRAIHTDFIPRMALMLKKELDNSDTLNVQTVYLLLKGYLAIGENRKVNKAVLVAPFETNTETLSILSAKSQSQIKHFAALASSRRLDALPLNHALLDKIRLRLQNVNLEERAFALLSAQSFSNQTAPLSIRSVFSNKRVFTSNNGVKPILGLFTTKGFTHDYKPNISSIIKHVRDDNKIIGLNSSTPTNDKLMQNVSKLYNQRYLFAWTNTIKQVNITPVRSVNELISQLTLLSDSSSPYKIALSEIDRNTHPIKDGNITINDYFNTLHQYLNSNGYSKTQQQMTNAREYIIKLNSAQNPKQAFYQASIEIIQGKPSNPVVELATSIKTMPQPVRKWEQQIINNIWQQFSNETIRYLNDQWNEEIKINFNNKISSRYPFDRNANSQAKIDDFSEFFSPKGKLLNFFNHYLTMFIKQDGHNWTLYETNHLQLQLPQQSVHFFQQVNQISELYFNNAGKPDISLTLTPVNLSDQLKGIKLVFGNDSINYQHGPEIPSQINWPSIISNNSLTINSFKNGPLTESKYGPWGLFKLINSGYCTLHNHGDQKLLSINMDNYHADFTVDSSSSINVMKLIPIMQLEPINKIGSPS